MALTRRRNKNNVDAFPTISRLSIACKKTSQLLREATGRHLGRQIEARDYQVYKPENVETIIRNESVERLEYLRRVQNINDRIPHRERK
jgi:hypothetical protein